MSVRVGVIGLGMGREHVVNFKNAPDCQVVALCDIDQGRLEAMCTEFGVPHGYRDYRDLLARDDIDAVSIAVPNFLHLPIAIDALRAGKHVLCEKPMALNAAEAEEMHLKAMRANRKFMMHFNFRFHHDAQWLKQGIDRGEIGDIYYVKTGWIRRRGVPGLGGWFTNRAQSGGGPLIDIAIHRLDLALWLMGYPEVVSVTGQTFSEIAPQIASRERAHFDVEDLASAFIRLKNDAVIVLEASWALNTPEWEFWYTDLYGTRGGGELRRNNEGHTWARIVREEWGHWHETWWDGSHVSKETAQAHFVRCIRDDLEPMASSYHGVQVMRILDAIYESADTGREVILD